MNDLINILANMTNFQNETAKELISEYKIDVLKFSSLEIRNLISREKYFSDFEDITL